MRPTFWLLFVVIPLMGVIVLMFFRDVKRVARREPIPTFFFGEIYPRDPLYSLALALRFAPYVTVFAILVLLLSLIVYLSFYPPC